LNSLATDVDIKNKKDIDVQLTALWPVSY